MKKIATSLCALGLGMSVSGSAFALEDLKEWYIAVEGSKLDLDIYTNDRDATPDRREADLNGYKVRVGWNWTDQFAIDLSYGATEATNFNNDTASPSMQDRLQVERYINLNLRYGAFAWENVKLGGLIGYSFDPKVSSSALEGQNADLDGDVTYGFFTEIYINKAFAIHFDWTHYFEGDDDDGQMVNREYRLQGISFGLSLSFDTRDEEDD